MLDLEAIPEDALQAVTGEELHRSSELFQVVKQLRMRLTNVTEESLDRSFEQHVQNVTAQLDKKLKELSRPSSREVEIIMARHGLCDASMQQMIILCESISPALGGALSQIRGMHSSYFADLQALETTFQQQLNEKDTYCEEAKAEVEAIDKECSQLMEATSLLDGEAVRNTTLIVDLRKQLREVNLEVARLQSMLDPDIQVTPRKKLDHTSGTMSSRSKDKTTPSPALTSTGVMDTSLARDVKGQITFDTLKSPQRPKFHPNSTSSQLLTASMKKVSGGNGQNSFVHDSTRYMDFTMSRRNAWGPSTSSSSNHCKDEEKKSSREEYPPVKTVFASSAQWLLDFRGELQNKLDKKIRDISLKECRMLIQQFYESKENQVSGRVLADTTKSTSKSSLGSTNSLQDVETMEIHVYRCMEKKYGLRTLAVEHAAMFLRGLKRFAEEHLDVKIFYKIFCNEVEEGFVKVQQELEKSIKDLVILQVMNAHSSREQEVLNQLIDAKLSGSEALSDHEYMDIVHYLYSDKDATRLRVLLGVECQQAQDRKVSGEGRLDPQRHLEHRPHTAPPASPVDTSDLQRRLGYVPAAKKFHNKASQPSKQSKQASGSKKTQKLPSDYFDLPFATFVRLCLQFQLDNHEKFLSKFRDCFVYYDDDTDGILSTDEFRKCFVALRRGQLGVEAEQACTDEELEMFDSLLILVDPNETGRITFSNAADRLNSIGKKAMSSPTRGSKASKLKEGMVL